MRNAETITAISAKIAAAITEATGTAVDIVTTENIDHLDTQYPLRAYDVHIAGLTGPEAEEISAAALSLSLYVRYSGYDADYWVSPEDEAEVGHVPALYRDEDAALDAIPARFLPDAPDGTPRTDADRDRTAAELEAVSRARTVESWGRLARRDPALVEALVTRYLSDHPAQGEDAEQQLAVWTAVRDQRDALVVAALGAGVTKTRVQEITGISRATINRIPGA